MSTPDDESSKRLFHAFKVAILTFVLTVLLGSVSRYSLDQSGLIPALLVLSVIVLLGIIFDVIGLAVAVADEQPFHAMAANGLSVGKAGVKLVRNADKVSNFCNDVIGDIAGTVGGAAGAVIVIRLLIYTPNLTEYWASVTMMGIVAAITVGGKSLGKYLALTYSRSITEKTARVLAWTENTFRIKIISEPKNNRRKREK